jgi:hypothetical protein
MLGARRAGVTQTAMKMQKAGLIQYKRGRILIRNRKAVEQFSCEYYAAINQLLQKWRNQIR